MFCRLEQSRRDKASVDKEMPALTLPAPSAPEAGSRSEVRLNQNQNLLTLTLITSMLTMFYFSQETPPATVNCFMQGQVRSV